MLLLSIHPEFVDKILSGEKSVELRRRRPRVQQGDSIVIYATAPRCELAGIADVLGIRQSTPRDLWRTVESAAAIDKQRYNAYFVGCKSAVGIVLGNAIAFDRPPSLNDLRFAWPGFHPPQGYFYLRREHRALIDQLR